jgi:hypothetical protein
MASYFSSANPNDMSYASVKPSILTWQKIDNRNFKVLRGAKTGLEFRMGHLGQRNPPWIPSDSRDMISVLLHLMTTLPQQQQKPMDNTDVALVSLSSRDIFLLHPLFFFQANQPWRPSVRSKDMIVLVNIIKSSYESCSLVCPCGFLFDGAASPVYIR